MWVACVTQFCWPWRGGWRWVRFISPTHTWRPTPHPTPHRSGLCEVSFAWLSWSPLQTLNYVEQRKMLLSTLAASVLRVFARTSVLKAIRESIILLWWIVKELELWIAGINSLFWHGHEAHCRDGKEHQDSIWYMPWGASLQGGSQKMFKVMHSSFVLEKFVRNYKVCRKCGVLHFTHATCWKVCYESPSCF